MLTVIVLALYGAVALLDLLPMFKKQTKKEKIVYCALMSVSLCVLLLYSLNIQVPGPSEPIKALVEKLVPPK